jgi:hypothetical protein
MVQTRPRVRKGTEVLPGTSAKDAAKELSKSNGKGREKVNKGAKVVNTAKVEAFFQCC